jgi:hypothetical protein
MRRTLLAESIALASLAACVPSVPSTAGWTDATTGLRLVIEPFDRHATLHDHRRALFVVGTNGQVRRLELHADAGAGAIANLYRSAGGLVLVDENGVWIRIGAAGQIESVRWRWRQPLPDDFLGTFELGPGADYQLVQRTEPEIYRYKDPPDGVERDS